MILSSSQRLFQPNKVYQEKISLINILTCLICTNKATQAHICPNCSKFYCEICIKQWLAKTEKACPNCRKQIEVNSLVNCNKLSQDLSGALQALIQYQFSNQQCCQTHSLGLSYYCHNCECSLCSDCIVMSQQHQGHKFVKINKIKVAYNQNVLRLLSKIRNKKKQLQKQSELLKLGENQDSKKLKIDKLHQYMGRIKDNYNNKINHHLQQAKDHYLKQLCFLNSQNKQYTMMLANVKQLSKVNLLKIPSLELEQRIQKFINSIGSCKTHDPNLKELQQTMQTAINPKRNEKNFCISNFSSYRTRRQVVVYSDRLNDGMNEWVLKIYPNGMSENERERKESGQISPRSYINSSYLKKSVNNEYVSIYIQMKSGVRYRNKYKHIVEIIHPADPYKTISRQFEFQFEVGSCLGHYHFTKIATLQQEGFISPEQNCLKIKVHLGYPSYYHAVLDFDTIVLEKETQRKQNARKISQLRKKLNLPDQQIIQRNGKQQNKVNSEDIVLLEKRSLRYTDYRMEKKQIQNKCGEEYDHQSKELSKIFRRISKSQNRGLLIF